VDVACVAGGGAGCAPGGDRGGAGRQAVARLRPLPDSPTWLRRPTEPGRGRNDLEACARHRARTRLPQLASGSRARPDGRGSRGRPRPAGRPPAWCSRSRLRQHSLVHTGRRRVLTSGTPGFRRLALTKDRSIYGLGGTPDLLVCVPSRPAEIPTRIALAGGSGSVRGPVTWSAISWARCCCRWAAGPCRARGADSRVPMSIMVPQPAVACDGSLTAVRARG
jgi:hypothetical protein